MSVTTKLNIKKVSGAVALVSAELLLILLAFSISLALLIIFIRQVFYHEDATFDERIFFLLSHYVNSTTTFVMRHITLMGSHFFLIPAWGLLFLYDIFIKKSKWQFIKMAIIAVSNLLLMFSLKFLFHRPRPLLPLLKEVPGLSFPSGHAFMSISFYGLLIYMVYCGMGDQWTKRITVFVLAIIIFMVGLSRVYLRLHYASDVIAGYCFGIVSLIILLWMLRQVEKYNVTIIPWRINITKTGGDSPLRKVS